MFLIRSKKTKILIVRKTLYNADYPNESMLCHNSVIILHLVDEITENNKNTDC